MVIFEPILRALETAGDSFWPSPHVVPLQAAAIHYFESKENGTRDDRESPGPQTSERSCDEIHDR